ncbi:Fe-S cluster assembly ATPase SufC [Candidatus Woesearchaeota archaeon]|nr:Fe-S cluster assembly ATPase SufC [Candidatus Woesearchaeota archaeon]
MTLLRVENLSAFIEDKKILDKINLSLEEGEVLVIMGPNGSGKSTLAQSLMGSPIYEQEGNIILDGFSLNELSADERSKKGLFLSFQHPASIEGVTISNFLRQAINTRLETPIRLSEYKRELNKNMDVLKLDSSFSQRYLNVGHSGGEKKKLETLQLLMLKPKVAILDETDSGLDVDALKIVTSGINTIKKEHPKMGIIVITHYNKILEYLKPNRVIVLKKGTVVKEGELELIKQIEENGYEQFT